MKQAKDKMWPPLTLVNDIYKEAERDARKAAAFEEGAKTVRWIGHENAKILFLVALPTQLDGERGEIDSSRKLRAAIEGACNRHWETAKIPKELLAFGVVVPFRDPGDRFKKDPDSIELDFSMPYLKRALAALPQLKVTVALDMHVHELLVRNLDTREMFLKGPREPFRPTTDRMSPTAITRKNFGAIERFHINGRTEHRYTRLPWPSSGTFVPFFRDLLFRALDTAQPLVNIGIIGSYEAPDAAGPSAPLLTAAEFKTRMRAHAAGRQRTTLPEFRQEDGAENPMWCARDVAADPYVRETGPVYFYMRDMRYNPHKNAMEMYGHTPTGTPVRTEMGDFRFTFWFSAHAAFADPLHPERWGNVARPLEQGHLTHLQERLRRKLYFASRSLPGCDGREDVTLTAVHGDKWTNNHGYLHTLVPSFVRCDVRHFNLVAKVVASLKFLVKEHEKQHPPDASHKRGREETEMDAEEDRADMVRHLESKFEVYGTLSAEAMFASQFNVGMSLWHRSNTAQIRPLAPGARYLEANIQWVGPESLRKLKKADAEPVGDSGYTSADTPDCIVQAFDIECAGHAGKFPSPFNSPVICISCITYVHRDKSTRFVSKKDGDKLPDFTTEQGYVYYAFMVGNMAPSEHPDLKGAEHVFSFATERDLLEAYFYFRGALMTEYLASHNGKNFDDPFLIRRARLLGAEIGSQGAHDDRCLRVTEKRFESKALAQRDIVHVDGQDGVTIVDTLEIYVRDSKYPSRTLNYLAGKLVNMTKADLHYSFISPFWKRDDRTRRKLMEYCHRDAQLVLQLLAVDRWVTKLSSLARASGMVAEDRIYEAGMQEKVYGAVAQANREAGGHVLFRTKGGEEAAFAPDEMQTENAAPEAVAFPALDRKRTSEHFISTGRTGREGAREAHVDMPVSQKKQKRQRTEREEVLKDLHRIRADAGTQTTRVPDYQGAVVMKVRLGWYTDRIALCADFSGLYPSIMMAYNLSGDTFVHEDDLCALGIKRKWCYDPSPGHRVTNPRTKRRVKLLFIRPEHRRGIMAQMEVNMKSLRDAAKKEEAKYIYEFLKDGTPNLLYDPVLGGNYTGEQLSYKLLGNSAYGAMGASQGVLAAKLVAAMVTAVGRDSAMLVRGQTEDFYGATCAGGDTDSVFMQFHGLPAVEGAEEPHPALAKAEESAREMAGVQARDDLRKRAREEEDREASDEELEAAYKKAKTECQVDYQWMVQGRWFEVLGASDTVERRFLKYRIDSIADANVFAKYVWIPRMNENFLTPMNLEFEKAMGNLFTTAPKRYGYMHCEPGKKPYLAFKGLEIVRRDSLPFTRETMQTVFDSLMEVPLWGASELEKRQLVRQKKEWACAYIRERARMLLDGEVPTNQLILSKLLSREHYTNDKQEHLTVMRKTEARGLVPPSLGDRVYYVYTLAPHDTETRAAQKGSAIADDPDWAVSHGTSLDYVYYFEHKFTSPISKVMGYILAEEIEPEVRAAIAGGSTRKEKDLVKAATLRYLFGAADASISTRSAQARYLHLSSGVVRKAPVASDDASRMGKYLSRQGVALQEARRLHVTYDDDASVLERVCDSFKSDTAASEERLAHCRGCIRVGADEEVVCGARDCRHYYPRVVAGGRVNLSRKFLEEVISDIEDLSLQSVKQEIKEEPREEPVRPPDYVIKAQVARARARAPPCQLSEEEKKYKKFPLLRFIKAAPKPAKASSGAPKRVTVASIIASRKSTVITTQRGDPLPFV